MRSGRADLTALLVAWSNGDAGAQSRLIEAVYAELRRLARGYLRRERWALAKAWLHRELQDGEVV